MSAIGPEPWWPQQRLAQSADYLAQQHAQTSRNLEDRRRWCIALAWENCSADMTVDDAIEHATMIEKYLTRPES
jgi:hypothetical protein